MQQRYDFQIAYEVREDRSKWFPYKFIFELFPDALQGVISHNEYQNIIELMKANGEPHNLLYGEMAITILLLLFLPSIIILKTEAYNVISRYALLFFIVLAFISPFILYKIYKYLKKKNEINMELKKRGIELKMLVKFRKYNFIIILFTFIQIMLNYSLVEKKWPLNRSYPNLVNDYSEIQIFIYIFIALDMVILIFLLYNYMLFTKFRHIISNSTQSEHLANLVENIKKWEVVPFYLSYDTQYIQTQPLLFSSNNNEIEV